VDEWEGIEEKVWKKVFLRREMMERGGWERELGMERYEGEIGNFSDEIEGKTREVGGSGGGE
jgi:hypothetical protein